MGAEGVRRRCDAVCTASTISQAKGQGFKSTETKHHVYGFLWKVDSFYRLFSYYLFIFIYLLLIFLRRSKEAVGLRGVIHRGEEKIMTFTDVLGKIDNFVWGVPLIVLIIAGVAIVWCITFFLGRRLAKTFWFERMIFAWGWWTGTMAMGIALLRIVDPKLSSKAMDDYAMAYLPIAPIEILLITFVPILFVNGLGVWLLLACLVLSLLILLLAWKMGWWITRS